MATATHVSTDQQRAVLADEQDAVARMVGAWESFYGGREPVKVRQIAEDAKRGAQFANNDAKLSALFDACHQALAGHPISAPALGRWFKRHEGHVVVRRHDGQIVSCRFCRSGGGTRPRFISLLDAGFGADAPQHHDPMTCPRVFGPAIS